MKKKRLISAAVTGILCVSMAVPGMAATEGGAVPSSNGTDVYAGITLNDPDAKIRVTVPTLFAFVVNGTVDATDASALVSTGLDPTILLPNVTVKVNPADAVSADRDYQLEIKGDPSLKFVNYSTRKDGATDRVGLKVEVVGSIRNEGTAKSRNYWEHVADADKLQGKKEGLKKYTLEIETIAFNRPEIDGSLAMSQAISLEAPDLTGDNLDEKTNYAKVGKTVETNFNVYVGGERGQYTQVEESAKIGSIVWTVQAEPQKGADTAPDNDFIDPDKQP